MAFWPKQGWEKSQPTRKRVTSQQGTEARPSRELTDPLRSIVERLERIELRLDHLEEGR